MNLLHPEWLGRLKSADAVTTITAAYEKVPPLYRAVELRASAIGTIPAKLYKDDIEVDWPFVQNLGTLLQNTERSLLLYGAAYWLRVYKGRTLTGFRVLNPRFVTVMPDANATVINPLENVRFQWGGSNDFASWTLDDIVYFREPSVRDEITPGLAPASVALQSAQLGHYRTRFVSHFFEGGAQPVTIMNLPEAMDESEFQRFRTEMRSSISNVFNAFKMIFMRSPDIKIEQLTPPINSLMLPELYQEAITSISMVLGVPRTMLEASAANYATADSDRQSFWRETVIPRLSMLQQTINEQVFYPLRHELNFTPEALDVMQTDEAARAGSLLQLVQAGVPLRGAMEILGYDGIDEALGTVIDVTASSPAPTADEIIVPDNAVDAEVATKRKAEWGLLAKKIERRIKAGKSAICTFESDVITADEVKSVMAHFTSATTVHEAHDVINAHKAYDDLTDDEKRIYNKIVRALEERGVEWARRIMRDEEVDPSLRDVLEPVLRAELQTTMQKRVDRLSNEFVPVDPTESGAIIQDWLADYMPSFNREIDITTQRVLTNVIAQWRTTEGMTVQDVAKALQPAVGKARASSIAITETTRAASQATVEYQKYLGARGVQMERIWNTDADDLVCPICVPLNGKGEDVWIADYPLGPPAHVRCRCDTGLRIVRE